MTKHKGNSYGFNSRARAAFQDVAAMQAETETRNRFFEAVTDGDIETMREILRKHPHAVKWYRPVDLEDKPFARNETALMAAAAAGQARAMRLLLGNGADIDAQHSRGWTALHHAAWRGHEEAVEVLLWHRADTSLANESGHTAAALAYQGGHNDLGRKISNADKIFSLQDFRRGVDGQVKGPKTAHFRKYAG